MQKKKKKDVTFITYISVVCYWGKMFASLFNYTELPKYYVWLQTAVACSLGWPSGRLAGHHTDAAPKHSLLFQLFWSRWSCTSMYICNAETLAFTDCDYY